MGGLADWAYLAGTVGLVTVEVYLVLWAVLPARAPLVRIEAQDHYLNVGTAKGNTLILMRLGDATAELSGQGIQVHRSHWVAPPAVRKQRRHEGRGVLIMADGAEVPVSRSFRAAAQQAGLL